MDINQKIIELESEIQNLKNNDIKKLENELFILKQEVKRINSGTKSESVSKTEFETFKNKPNNMQQQIVPQKVQQSKPQKQKVDFEKKLGQNFMGILASLLIFIGLGLFIVLIYDYLTDPLKVFGMYTLSFSILGLGLFLFKKKNDIFSLSLTGCGIGTVYISILMTNVYFHYIGNILMYILIVAWLTGIICLSSKLKDELITSNTISIIGQIGIAISVILGTGNFKTIQELFLISFFLIITSLMHWILTKGTNKNILKNISLFTISLSGLLICGNLNDYIAHTEGALNLNPIVVGFLGIIIIGYNLVINFTYYKNNTSKSWFKGIMMFVTSILTLVAVDNIYNSITMITQQTNKTAEIFLLTAIAFIIFIICEINTKTMFVRIPTFIIFNIFMVQLVSELDMFKYVGLAIMFVPYLILGHIKKDELYKIVGYICLSCDILFFMGRVPSQSVAWGMFEYFIIFLTICGSYGYMIFKKEMYNVGDKIVNYVIFIAATPKMFGLLDFDYSSTLSYIIVTLINVIAFSTIFVCNWKTLNGISKKDNDVEKLTNMVCNIMNHLLMFIGFISIYLIDNGGWHFATIIALTFACFIGSYNLLEKFKDTKWVGFYIGIKSTIYINVIFYSFTFLTENAYLSSICSLALAVIAIVVGFKLEVKSLRIYGLILSMLSIFKLLLIDIQYDNSIGRVLSFIMAGILCFGINFVYNIASKKVTR